MADIDITKIRQLDFTLLLILQGLLRHGRTTSVAEELGLSQPAISHSLTRLRNLFDDPLFVRKPHGLSPTQHAIALAPHVEQMLQGASTAIGLASHFSPDATTRDFRIGAPEHLGSLIAGPLLNAMETVAPHARITLKVEFGIEAIRSIEQHQIDVAVGQFQQPSERLRTERLYEDRFVLVAKQGHPLIKSRIGKRLFERLTHVVVSPSGDARAFIDNQLEAVGISRRVVARVPRFQTAFEVVKTSDSVVLAPQRLAQFYARDFGLTFFSPPVKLRPIEVLLVRRLHHDPGLDWLAEMLVQVTRATV